MYVVENTSDTTQRFNEADPQGGFRKIFLAPGESGTFDIDPLQGRFHRGALKATPVPVEKPAKARRKAKRPKA